MEPTNWTRNKPKDAPIVPQTKNYRNLVALIIIVLGTLVLTTGAVLAFGLPAAIVTFGVALFVFGLALGFSKD
jgi:hypothetical protein